MTLVFRISVIPSVFFFPLEWWAHSAPLGSDLNLLLVLRAIPPKHLLRTSFRSPCRPFFHFLPTPSPNVQRSLVFHHRPLVGCAAFPLSRSTRRHDLRKWVRYLRNDYSGPFGFRSLQGVHLPKALRRNPKRTGACGDTVAERDVSSGCIHGSPFIKYASIVLHIKSSIRCQRPSL